MNHRLATICALIFGIVVFFSVPVKAAINRIYHPSLASLVDSVAALPIPDGAQSATVEVRFTMPGLRLSEGVSSRSVSIVWNYADSANYTALSVSYGRCHFDDMQHPTYAALSVVNRCDGVDSIVWTRMIASDFTTPAAENALAVTLSQSGDAEIYFGHPRPESVDVVPASFNSSLPIAVGAVGEADIKLAVADVELPDPTVAALPVYTSEELSALITDSNPGSPVGVWQYLDRDTDPIKASPGGQYRLAIIPSDSGAFHIVYLGGAEVAADSWHEGMVKAVLTPTPFANHYNLTWIDAHHEAHPRELHATLDTTNAILTLSFPLLNSTIRLYRLK